MRYALIILLLLNFWGLNFNTAWADEYYLAQWEWISEPNDSRWQAPHIDKYTGCIDLRSLPQCGRFGGTPEGYGIFTYKDKITDSKLFYLGGSKDGQFNKDVIKDKLGFTLNSSSVKDSIWELLTVHADPTGQTFVKPLMPGLDKKMRLTIGSEGAIKVSMIHPFVSPEWDKILAVMQNDLIQLNSENTILASKVLDSLQEQWGIHYAMLLPPDIDLVPIAHATTFTESFNQGDSTTLGPDLTWGVVENGGLQTLSNELAPETTSQAETERAEHDVGSSDNLAKIDFTVEGGITALVIIIARMSSSALTGYTVRRFNDGTKRWRTEKLVDGATTILNGPANRTYTLPITVEVQVQGSSIKFFEDDAEIFESTDTVLTVGTRGGIRLFSNDGALRADNFEFADFLGDVPTRNRAHMLSKLDFDYELEEIA